MGQEALHLAPASRTNPPVQHTFFPYIEEADQDNGYVNQHLPETEHLQLAQDDRPGIQEHGFHVEQDKHHRDQVELDGKALARVPHRGHAAFIGGKLGSGRLSFPNNPGQDYNRARNRSNYDEMDKERQVTCEVIVRHRRAIYNARTGTTLNVLDYCSHPFSVKRRGRSRWSSCGYPPYLGFAGWKRSDDLWL